MVIPALIGGVALGVSAGANLYAQYNQRKLYRQQYQAYRNLHNGYANYLRAHGRSINPDRAWTSYYGQAQKARNNLENSIAGSIGTTSGTFGAGVGLYGRDIVKALHKRL